MSGSTLANWLFDIDLDLSDVPDLISKTMERGNEAIFDLVKQYIIENLQTQWVHDQGDPYVKNPFHCSTQLPNKYSYKGKSGYFLLSEHEIDIRNRLGGNYRNLSMAKFAQILQCRWKGTLYQDFKFKEIGTHKAIFLDCNDTGLGSNLDELEMLNFKDKIIDNEFTDEEPEEQDSILIEPPKVAPKILQKRKERVADKW